MPKKSEQQLLVLVSSNSSFEIILAFLRGLSDASKVVSVALRLRDLEDGVSVLNSKAFVLETLATRGFGGFGEKVKSEFILGEGISGDTFKAVGDGLPKL